MSAVAFATPHLAGPSCAPPPAAGERDLLDRLRAGDGEAFAELVREHGGRLLAVAQRFLRSSEDSADAVQEAFLAAFRSLGSFQGSSALSTWLHRILVNACLMKLRSRSRRRESPVEDLLPRFDAAGRHAGPVPRWMEDPHERLAAEEVRQTVRRAIQRLPDSLRVVLLLRDIEELDTEETARLLGISLANVKTRLHRARQALRALLEPAFACRQ
jgi:RNA polymerase sigma-70 factor (ECF subfamily)